jgi:tetratricopeptide (TPR) repeat protein
MASRLGEMSGAYRVEHPHNEHLEILHDGGVIGYLLFLWIVIEAVVSLIRRRDIIDVGIAVALFGLLCDGLLSQNLRFMVIASLFWLLIGFANRAEFSPEQYQSRSIFEMNAPQLLGIMSLLVLMGGTVWFAYNLMQADAYVKDGMGYYSSKQYQHAVSQFAEALSRDSRNKRALYYSASAYRLMDKTDQAMKQYAQLLELDPNFLQMNFFLGTLYIQKREVENAVHYFERQIAGNNMHWKACYNLAILEFQQKNRDKGIRYLQAIETIHAIRPIDAEIFQKVRTMLAQHATLTTYRR